MVQGSSSRSRDPRRPVIVGGIIAAAAVVGIAAWSLAPRAVSVSAPAGPRLSIDVVAPIEPVPLAGDILEVGMLNDGFDRAALDRPPEITTADYMPPDAYVGEDAPAPEPAVDPRPAFQPVATASVATVTTTDPLQDGSRLFGFDRRPVQTSAQPPSAADPAIQSEPAKDDDTFFE